MNNDSLELIDIKSMDEAQLQAYFEQLGEKNSGHHRCISGCIRNW